MTEENTPSGWAWFLIQDNESKYLKYPYIIRVFERFKTSYMKVILIIMKDMNWVKRHLKYLIFSVFN
ncbi:hypothetical protein [uncultured Methanobrevibacter sp.]|uniref:hypothetical protein n=1 Tax=uncultured Methanobrevibacter sp. TaxID=253161 RepID=UPI0025DCB3BE|nr:hypothetical protein [uncultured Methanobrevibacter sp.]